MGKIGNTGLTAEQIAERANSQECEFPSTPDRYARRAVMEYFEATDDYLGSYVRVLPRRVRYRLEADLEAVIEAALLKHQVDHAPRHRPFASLSAAAPIKTDENPSTDEILRRKALAELRLLELKAKVLEEELEGKKAWPEPDVDETRREYLVQEITLGPLSVDYAMGDTEANVCLDGEATLMLSLGEHRFFNHATVRVSVRDRLPIGADGLVNIDELKAEVASQLREQAAAFGDHGGAR